MCQVERDAAARKARAAMAEALIESNKAQEERLTERRAAALQVSVVIIYDSLFLSRNPNWARRNNSACVGVGICVSSVQTARRAIFLPSPGTPRSVVVRRWEGSACFD